MAVALGVTPCIMATTCMHCIMATTLVLVSEKEGGGRGAKNNVSRIQDHYLLVKFDLWHNITHHSGH